jgi:hypothetical protein
MMSARSQRPLYEDEIASGSGGISVHSDMTGGNIRNEELKNAGCRLYFYEYTQEVY